MTGTQTDKELVGAFLRAIEGRYGSDVAAEVPGITADDISRWRRGAWKRLTEPKRRAIRAYLAAHGTSRTVARERERRYGDEAVIPPNYEGLGIEIPERSRLVPRAREAFDRFVHELIDRGLGREDIEHFGRAVIAPIAHLNTLHRGRDEGDTETEEAQLQIIERNADVVRRIIRSGGGGR